MVGDVSQVFCCQVLGGIDVHWEGGADCFRDDYAVGEVGVGPKCVAQPAGCEPFKVPLVLFCVADCVWDDCEYAGSLVVFGSHLCDGVVHFEQTL